MTSLILPREERVIIRTEGGYFVIYGNGMAEAVPTYVDDEPIHQGRKILMTSKETTT